MALDKITTDIIADDAVTAAKIVAGAVEADIRADAIGTAEIANDVTISTSGDISTTGTGAISTSTTGKIKQGEVISWKIYNKYGDVQESWEK